MKAILAKDAKKLQVVIPIGMFEKGIRVTKKTAKSKAKNREFLTWE